MCVGSTNPVKVNAVTLALSQPFPEAKVEGFEVPSGVSAQPMTDEETRQGAQNRAQAALEQGRGVHPQAAEVFGLGLEGGVFQNDQGELWSTVWAVVMAPDGQRFEANGCRIKIPDSIAQPILNGDEMGPTVQKLTGLTNVRQKQGMFGVITNNFVTRTEEYAGVAKIALGLWYGRDWDKMLPL
jgi:inosine/xanthosine triphosphatase